MLETWKLHVRMVEAQRQVEAALIFFLPPLGGAIYAATQDFSSRKEAWLSSSQNLGKK